MQIQYVFITILGRIRFLVAFASWTTALNGRLHLMPLLKGWEHQRGYEYGLP